MNRACHSPLVIRDHGVVALEEQLRLLSNCLLDSWRDVCVHRARAIARSEAAVLPPLPLTHLGPDEGDRVCRRRDGGEERVRDARRERVDAEDLVQGVAAELR